MGWDGIDGMDGMGWDMIGWDGTENVRTNHR